MFFLLGSHAHPIEVWGWSGKSCSKAGALQVNEDTNSLVPTFEEALSRKCLYEFYHSLLRLTVLLLMCPHPGARAVFLTVLFCAMH